MAMTTGRVCRNPSATSNITFGRLPCRGALAARPSARRSGAVRVQQQENSDAGVYLPLRIMSNVSGLMVTFCPPSCAMEALVRPDMNFTSSAISEMSYVPMASSGIAMEDRYLQAAIEAGSTAFDQALLSMCDVQDMLSTMTDDFLDIQAGISGQRTTDVAARMSQQAMAVASEALNLATIMETGTRHGTEERALVAQIEEAARIVAIRAREIAGQPLELGDVGASVMQGIMNQ